jgi:hypothetical protein
MPIPVRTPGSTGKQKLARGQVAVVDAWRVPKARVFFRSVAHVRA